MQATNGSVEYLQLRYLQDPGNLSYQTLFVCSNLSSAAGDLKSFIGPNLRSIRFFTGSPFRLMEFLFTSCPHDARLESIILEGPLSPGYDLLLSAAIDSAVVYLRSLKMVEVRAYPWSGYGMPFDVWSAAVLSSFPSLVRRGMLTLTEIPRRSSFSSARYFSSILTEGEDEVHHGWE